MSLPPFGGHPEKRAAQYLEFMIHGFMNGLITLQELEGISDGA